MVDKDSLGVSSVSRVDVQEAVKFPHDKHFSSHTALKFVSGRSYKAPSTPLFFAPFKMGSLESRELLTHNVKEIKDAAYESGDVDISCNRGLRQFRSFKVCLHVSPLCHQNLILCPW